MASPKDHLQALEKEVAQLQGLLTANKHTVTDLDQSCRDIRAEFEDMNKKHARLTRTFENCRTELWSAASRADRKAAARAEERMSDVIEEQVKIQRLLPRLYGKLGEMIGARDATRESIREYKDKVARKVEEIHTLKPCQSLTCAHCGRGGAAALSRAKTNIRERVGRIWKAE